MSIIVFFEICGAAILNCLIISSMLFDYVQMTDVTQCLFLEFFVANSIMVLLKPCPFIVSDQILKKKKS
ncbi:hypothetical protein BpHYR1_029340 [Brachionus plicatilis]|uniref:Uncharacterized protein n=1 Tax=Brachionus plicatilis TaxID=10195 RepID=A0A3M7PCC9_BRAPC|nr:hypothetical protein BpHYR1_029340 [Brachionus plicatilis]